jgi:hypothetical protein
VALLWRLGQARPRAWILDVMFRDDLARLRSGHGPATMAVVEHMAMALRRQPRPTTSLNHRRKLVGWSLDQPDELIRGAANPIHPKAPARSGPRLDFTGPDG